MRAGLTLPDWNSLASLDDDTLPLLATALLIARDEYPQLDADVYDAMLQGHAEHLRGEIESIDPWPMKMQAINRHLFEEVGYCGNHDEYYDPRNSYLNEVFERRLGNPISLAMVQMEVARPPRRAVGRRIVSWPLPGAVADRRRHPGDGSVQSGPTAR
jgi:regulator of sirC expression with transglutaminase-like and TPR domain